MHRINKRYLLLLTLTFLTFGVTVSAQSRNKMVRTYPTHFQDILIDTATYPFRYKEVLDPESGKLSVVANPAFEKKDFDYDPPEALRITDPTQYTSEIRGLSFPLIDPSLDTLPDGEYVQFYPPLPYHHKDTLKYFRNLPAVRFTMQNNLPQGEATWYLPNHQVHITGFFENGLKTGQWLHTTFSVRAKKERRKISYSLTKEGETSVSISNDEFNGTMIIREFLSSKPARIKTEEISFKNGRIHGPYRYVRDSVVLVQGAYNMGQETGEWFRYDWDNDQASHRQLRQHYTIADKRVVSRKPIIRSDYYPQPDNQPFVLSIKTGPFFAFSSSYDKEFDQSPDNFGYFYRIRSLPSDTANQSLEFKLEYGEFLGHWLTTVDKIKLTGKPERWRNELLTKNGYEFPFEGIYEEYRENGQLRLRFEIRDGNLLKEDTVFYSDGLPMNVVNYIPETKSYEQKFFSVTGVLIEHRLYDSLGIQTTALVDGFHLTKNNRVYQLEPQSHEDNWIYSCPTQSLTGSDSILVKEVLRARDQSMFFQQWFFPETQNRSAIRYYGSIPAVSKQLLTATAYVQSATLFDRLTTETRLTPAQYKTYQSGSDSTRFLPLIAAPEIIYLDGQPFTGKLTIKLDQKKMGLEGNAEHLTLSLPLILGAGEQELLATLLPRFSKIIYNWRTDYIKIWHPFYERSDYNTKEDYDKKDRKQHFVQRIEAEVKNGQLDGAFRVANGKKDLLMTATFDNNLREGAQLCFRSFPDRYLVEDYRDQATWIRNFHHDTLHGLVVEFNTHDFYYYDDHYRNRKLDTALINTYKMGELHGRQFSMESAHHDYIENYEPVTSYYLNDKKNGPYQRLSDQGIPLETYYYENDLRQGEAVLYHHNGRVAERGRFEHDFLVDTAYVYDTSGFVTDQIIYKNGFPIKAHVFRNGLLARTLMFDTISKLHYGLRLTYTAEERLNNGISRHTSIAPHYANAAFFDVYGRSYQKGRLSDGNKYGIWQYMPVDLPAYQIDYRGTPELVKVNDSIEVLKYGTLIQKNDAGETVLKQELISLESHYNCTQDEYYETRVFYTVFEKDSSMHQRNGWVKNHFDNGGLQSEGQVVDGLPEGLWKFYNPDGTLNMAGYYNRGRKDGRWLKGDLSKVNYLGDICLDPDTANAEKKLEALKQQLEINIIYYNKGEHVSSQHFEVNLGK